jgi:hypothetical protein
LSLLTGKKLGKEESQVTVLVRSLTYGGDENVPMARKFPVPCRLSTVRLLGTTASESRGSGAGADVVVMMVGGTADTTVVSGFVHTAVIVVSPTLLPMTSPLVVAVQVTGLVTGRPLSQIVATDGMLEAHVRYPVIAFGVVMLVKSS